jgi:hypothetical protein
MTVSEDEFVKHISKLTRLESNELDEFIGKISPGRRKELEKGILTEKAMDFVLEKAVAVEPGDFNSSVITVESEPENANPENSDVVEE